MDNLFGTVEVPKFENLYKRTKTGAVQEWQIEVFDETPARILVTQGQLDGKKQEYPETITVGKQKRSPLEQAISQAQSTWNKQRDKGYKCVSELSIKMRMTESSFEYMYNEKIYPDAKSVLLEALPLDSTDASGNLKPMKCTPFEDGVFLNKKGEEVCKIKFPCIVQPKLDGVRMFNTITEDGINATSSGGKSYKFPAAFINKELESYNLDFNILDGEIYIHGVDLQLVSGWARTEYYIPEQEKLEYHVYDLPSNLPFKQRLANLEELFEDIPVTSRVKLVPYDLADNLEELKELHDKWVRLGYEGIIIRNEDGVYLYGKRSTEIFKWKNFQDAEFEIIGADLGKRGTEDMVFWFVTLTGKKFKANPEGDRAAKEKFWAELESLKGKFATVKFLTYSKDGIPQGNTIMKAIRDYE